MPAITKNPLDRGVSTEDWIAIARLTLIKEGVAAVKVDRLAKRAKVTRGGFYYRFKSRQRLLDALLEDWRATNHQPIMDVLAGPGSPATRFLALIQLWLEERDYSPDYDAAIRDWARVSPKVAALVHRTDDLRIGALKHLFLDAGYDEAEAFVRARITYFHQVGYYAMGVRESAKRRAELSELYYRILTGFRNGDLGVMPSTPGASTSSSPRAKRSKRSDDASDVAATVRSR